MASDRLPSPPRRRASPPPPTDDRPTGLLSRARAEAAAAAQTGTRPSTRGVAAQPGATRGRGPTSNSPHPPATRTAQRTALQPVPQPAPLSAKPTLVQPPPRTARKAAKQAGARSGERTAVALRAAAPVAAPQATWPRSALRFAGGLIVAGMLLATLGWGALQNLRASGQSSPSDVSLPGLAAQIAMAPPAASGHGPANGPWASSAAVSIVVPTGGGEPCNDPVQFVPDVSLWTIPPGCYGNIYHPNPANYVQRPGYGWCNWWVRVRHPDHPDITENKSYPEGSKPVPGAAVFFFGNVQGADSAGHWAQVAGVAPDGYWVLISEMNFDWRGAGWTRVDYRYIHAGPGVVFIYA